MGRKLYLPLVVFLLSVLAASAQTGEIRGRVTEKGGKEPIPFASIVAMVNGIQVLATSSDIDGNYTLKPLNPGSYDIQATNVGYQPVSRPHVLVTGSQIAFVDIELGKGVTLGPVEVVDYAIPLLDKGKTDVSKTVSYEEIQAAPTRTVNSIAARTAGVFQADEDEGLNMRGSRDDATAYYVDGIKVRGGGIGLPQKGTEQITVITGGIPAQYGDLTGGVISVTTRGPSNEYGGGVEVATSELLDKYGYNLASANVTGPIIFQKDSAGTKTGQSIAGFFFAGEYQYDKDPNPSVIPIYKLRDDLLEDLKANPLIKAPQTAGGSSSNNYISRASYYTNDDFVTQKYRENVGAGALRLSGKIDIRPVKNLNLTLGGSYENADSREYSDIYSMYNYENNTQKIVTNWRAYFRLTQRFSSENDKASSAVKNAFYSIQVDYSQNKQTNQNKNHKDNIFNYGYVGSFKSYAVPSYQAIFGTDSIGNNYLDITRESNVDTAVIFTAGSQNPSTANFTSQYYDLTKPFGTADYTDNLSNIQQNGGLLNGDNRINQNVYSLFATSGRVANGYSFSDNRQARIVASGSADIKNHNIIIGLEYEQRTDRGFAVSPNDLWSLMRQLGNLNLSGGDEATAINIDTTIGGLPTHIKDYSRGHYVQALNADSEAITGFYENIRAKTGLNIYDTIQTDSYDPSMYSLSLFSPDELIAGDGTYVNYYGYDYTGETESGNSWDLNKFYVDKDDNNNYLRKVDAFRPTYIAGYISDKFTFNDIIFNVGVRIDRFDANQKVLKDKYSLFETVKAGDASVKEKISNAVIPDNIGDDYVVYVNNSQHPSSITGFRNGDVWYNKNGTVITDLTPLTTGGGSAGGIQPMLTNYEDYQHGRVNPNAFADYEPQVNVMPRIAFSFPISDEAYFAAHYDVLTQRPQDPNLIRFNPISYLNWAQGKGGTFSNPDLKPERTTMYEINFQQKLSRSSMFSISTFYKELRDNIQIINVESAFPIKYSTYGNIDFGTVKGLTFGYDLRRTNNIRMFINYTLSFADGTGSDEASSQGILAQAGQTNLREVKPLNFDQRHTFEVSLDYHYGSGTNYDGPVWWNKQVFAKAGVNIDFHAGSGTPYTRKSNITPEADFTTTENSRSVISGSINGSRYPWNFRIDAKFDKDFAIKTGTNKDGDARKPIYANVYLQILNVLNTVNVTSVWAATGSPSDDGYIDSPAAQSKIDQQASPQAYIDMYRIAVDNPSNYSLPRRIRLGIQLNF